jgi:serine/threonine protein kinase
LDYGNTVRAATCDPKPGSVGTIPYLAPEMESTPYDQRVDIWACGIFGLGLFVTNGSLRWQNVIHARGKYDTTLADLQDKSPASVENLLGELLAWDPAGRVSAEFALKHNCFSGLPCANHPSDCQPGQKRSRSESDLS